MKPAIVYSIVFSPTGTSKKIAAAIAQGFPGAKHATIDLTQAAAPSLTLPAESVALFALPVYGGHVPPIALERLAALRGEGTPAVTVALYGNRAFEHAVAESAAFIAARGFIPVAAAAFVGEHSYSTPQNPIAAGRPDAADLSAAVRFGEQVALKLAQASPAAVDATALRTPRTPLGPLLRFIRFVLRYRRTQKRQPLQPLPHADAALCKHCGRCAKVCPTQAIAPGNELHTHAARCIRCCACVKNCPTGARRFDTPFAAALARSFARPKPPVTLL